MILIPATCAWPSVLSDLSPLAFSASAMSLVVRRSFLDRSTYSKFVYLDYCELSVKIDFTELGQPSA